MAYNSMVQNSKMVIEHPNLNRTIELFERTSIIH